MTDYFRGDQAAGITAPDLSKNVGFSDHIVKARGKRTQFTSVSKDAAKIKDFGEMAYRLKQPELLADQHTLLEHEALMTALRTEANESDKAVRLKAVQAQRYAKKRLEGLVSWKFDTSGVPPNGLITWAASRVQAYFQKA